DLEAFDDAEVAEEDSFDDNEEDDDLEAFDDAEVAEDDDLEAFDDVEVAEDDSFDDIEEDDDLEAFDDAEVAEEDSFGDIEEEDDELEEVDSLEDDELEEVDSLEDDELEEDNELEALEEEDSFDYIEDEDDHIGAFDDAEIAEESSLADLEEPESGFFGSDDVVNKEDVELDTSIPEASTSQEDLSNLESQEDQAYDIANTIDAVDPPPQEDSFENPMFQTVSSDEDGPDLKELSEADSVVIEVSPEVFGMGDFHMSKIETEEEPEAQVEIVKETPVAEEPATNDPFAAAQAVAEESPAPIASDDPFAAAQAVAEESPAPIAAAQAVAEDPPTALDTELSLTDIEEDLIDLKPLSEGFNEEEATPESSLKLPKSTGVKNRYSFNDIDNGIQFISEKEDFPSNFQEDTVISVAEANRLAVDNQVKGIDYDSYASTNFDSSSQPSEVIPVEAVVAEPIEIPEPQVEAVAAEPIEVPEPLAEAVVAEPIEVPEPQVDALEKAVNLEEVTPEFKQQLSGMIEGVVTETIKDALQSMLPEMVEQIVEEELDN
ncbi:MAG: hypothetical protein QNL04_03495, partial [SAR324 cluster bacterium]|nr:hypothetical protein [SAR324 cluster bacterium]